MIDCSGTISADTTSRKTIPLPRYRSLANAKPAVVDTTRMIAIDAAQTSVELSSWPATGRFANSSFQPLSEWPACRSNCPALRNALSMMYQNGYSITTAMMTIRVNKAHDGRSSCSAGSPARTA